MDLKKVFSGISQKLQSDFDISSEINHRGNKGSYRESALREFLLDERLPKKFGVGAGEIIGPSKNVSKQSDLVIYDQIDAMPLVYNDDVQVYPIEAVYGVIEVKSKLSKQELVKSLENIKSVKSLCPNENVEKHTTTSMMTIYPRPKPFGIVFAYSLADNSLESLVQNLREWEKENSKEYWPNLVVVLGEGVLYHFGESISNSMLFDNDGLQKAVGSSYLAYQNDTLFHFYSTLLDLCNGMFLGPLNLQRYFDPTELVGSYVVKNHDGFQRQGEDGTYRLTQAFIDKVVKHCKEQGKVSRKELLLKQVGQIPQGSDNAFLNFEMYHYDPDNLPGMHEVENLIDFSNGGAVATEKMLMPAHWIEVDGEVYNFSMSYIEPDCYEKVDT